jgi:hypothetical protein
LTGSAHRQVSPGGDHASQMDPTRRGVLKAMGLGGLGAAANLAGVVQTGVRQLPVLPAPRARVDQTFIGGWKSVQLHSHSNRVVSQLPWTAPREVFEWYLTHGFQVVALTNLNHYTPVGGLAAWMDDPGFFLVIQGEEPSFEPDGVGVRIIDTLGVGITGPVGPPSSRCSASSTCRWAPRSRPSSSSPSRPRSSSGRRSSPRGSTTWRWSSRSSAWSSCRSCCSRRRCWPPG